MGMYYIYRRTDGPTGWMGAETCNLCPVVGSTSCSSRDMR